MQDLIVIGAGPGGYVAAVRAAQLGMSVTIVEKDQPGGVCLNWGCIPSKNLIHQADNYRTLADMEAVGVSVDRSTFDYSLVQAKSRDVVKTLTGGVLSLLKKNKVEVIAGTASLVAAGEVAVQAGGGVRNLKGKHILLATGSSSMDVAGFEIDEQRVLSSTGVLAMPSLPKSLLILGGGAIGCEFAYVMNSFGVNITLVEALGHILPSEDYETCAVLDTSFRRNGINVRVATRATRLISGKDGVTVTLQDSNDKIDEVVADKALVVFGRTPNTSNLGLQRVGVNLDERGYVEVGQCGQTSVPGVYAIGDITSTPALAHVASTEGELAVSHMCGTNIIGRSLYPDAVPSAVYCEPQVAGFGLREDRALADDIPLKKSVFHYPGAGKSIAVGKPEGLVKILCDPVTNEILGAHIVGHNATELLHELLLAKNGELLPEDLGEMMHAHPTLSEAVMEAARGIYRAPIHG